ncbi:MAG TPA: 50S ribosomal protein L18 [Candidatus Saccharibacteria bacterium]|jgi:large subunit ribosomal protein L18|nr:50S ribosomal protein L18 [Candidatus Saccharibacteria bacterium]HMT55384.1 50S ribosomal protein L18 [Candidatus Saccharibacteria bacterium]
MSDKAKKIQNRASRLARTRATIHGTEVRPRLSVHVSNLHISAQIINDDTHQTVVSASTIGKKMTGTMSDKAAKIGEEIAKAASKHKITAVVFDRGSKQYHGRMKALADAARKNGLEF